jgi:cell division protein FtsQ
LGAAVIAGGFLFAAVYPGFEPKHIAVLGNRRVSRNEILARAAIAPHESIWIQNTGAMARRIAAIPYIATASVRRVPPATLRIRVTERAPFAVLQSGAAEALVDHSLRVLEPAGDDAPLPLLIVAPGTALTPGAFAQGGGAIELRGVYDALVTAQLAPLELRFDRFGGIVATLHGGLRLLLGSPGDLAQKLRLARAILAQLVNGRRVAAVDLRAPSAPVLVYR